MAVLYRGAGVNTWWHRHDARLEGFHAWVPGKETSVIGIAHHIVRGTIVSPYVSLTRSYGIAFSYATLCGHRRPTRKEPAFLYELEIEASGDDIRLIDPVIEIAASLPAPSQNFSYQHDGGPDYLLGVTAPERYPAILTRPYRQAPPGEGAPRPPLLTVELEAMVRSLRDAEILAVRQIPRFYVQNRYEVW
jgi:hypothetical protein